MKIVLLLALLFGSIADNYDRLVIGDHPVFYWNDASGSDVGSSHRNGVLKNGPGKAAMPDRGVGMDVTRQHPGSRQIVTKIDQDALAPYQVARHARGMFR